MLKKISEVKVFDGQQLRYQHTSNVLSCDMKFSVYLPPQAKYKLVPALYWLSGLTCTDENFVTKAGAQKYAAEQGIAVIVPDTSPRGDGVPDDPEAAYDFGLGAGFYLNATQKPWDRHYRMYDYVVEELPQLIAKEFTQISERAAISGHSMGGHGALTIALKNSERFCSVSAFSPICSPMNCPWGEKALSQYLGADRQQWLKYDSIELLKTSEQHLPVLVDQGDADDFLVEQLKTERLIEAAKQASYAMTIRLQAGYDHSYYFIASFIGEHIAFHARYLKK